MFIISINNIRCDIDIGHKHVDKLVEHFLKFLMLDDDCDAAMNRDSANVSNDSSRILNKLKRNINNIKYKHKLKILFWPQFQQKLIILLLIITKGPIEFF